MATFNPSGVLLLDHMGVDATPANFARISFSADAMADGGEMSDRDIRLTRFLAHGTQAGEGFSHPHWTPFAHCQLSFRITAPLFVARQLGKHQVGFVWSEESRRYIKTAPAFFEFEGFRSAAENVKQGSATEFHPDSVDFEDAYAEWCEAAVKLYNTFIERGVCPEQARALLPQSLMVSWIWTGSLYGFARMAHQRLDPHAQLETRQVARSIADTCAHLYPVAWARLMERPY